MTVGHSEKAADRHDVSLCAAVLVHRDVLRRVWLLAAAIVIVVPTRSSLTPKPGRAAAVRSRSLLRAMPNK